MYQRSSSRSDRISASSIVAWPLRYSADPPERFRQRCVDASVVREECALRQFVEQRCEVFSVPPRCYRAQ